MRIASRLAAAALACSVASAAPAAVTGFTSKAAFDAATVGLKDVASLDFDGIAADTLIPSGTGTVEIGFTYAIGALESLVVIDDFATTSPPNSLGVTNDLAFLAGDSFAMDVPPATAIGLYVIGEDMLPGDVALSVGADSVANGAPEATLGDGSSVYFLGLLESDPLLAFTSATLTSFIVEDVGDFVWNIDDIRAAPEPAAGLGAGASLIALAALARRIRA